MPVAAAIAGVVGAGASIIASNKAANTAKDSAAASNALQSQIYQQNAAALSPYQTRGNAAGDAINSLLGLKGSASTVGASYPGASPDASLSNVDWDGYVHGNQDALNQWETDPQARAMFGGSIDAFGQFHYQNDGARRDLTPYQGAQQSSTNTAFDQFKNGTEYQSRLQQGQNSVTAALGSKGLLDSGAALKGLTRYGQTFASNEFGNYLSYLQGQQSVGLSAASAQAGAGQSYANATSANNNAAAEVVGNAALSNGRAINSALGNFVTAYGYSKGLGSSYGALR